MKAAERKKYYRAANRIVREQYLDGAIKNAENAENYQGRHRQMVALKVKGSRGWAMYSILLRKFILAEGWIRMMSVCRIWQFQYNIVRFFYMRISSAFKIWIRSTELQSRSGGEQKRRSMELRDFFIIKVKYGWGIPAFL